MAAVREGKRPAGTESSIPWPRALHCFTLPHRDKGRPHRVFTPYSSPFQPLLLPSSPRDSLLPSPGHGHKLSPYQGSCCNMSPNG